MSSSIRMFFVISMILAAPVAAQQQFVVAVINDGPADRLEVQHEIFIDELLALTASEFDVQIRHLFGQWSKESIDAVFAEAYGDPEVDLVLVTGFVANQLAATKRSFAKPTFLPMIIDTGLLNIVDKVGRSGVANLNYLSVYADFADDLDALAKIVSYQNLVLFVDEGLSLAIPQLRDAAYAASIERGIELLVVTHDGNDHRLMNRVPANTDAIFVAVLPQMPPADFDLLIHSINAADLPSYSLIGGADVESGLLFTNSEPRDIYRQARLNALNMQAVMLGERAEDQPIASQNKQRLTINMATARKIGLSPSFDILNEAIILQQEEEVVGHPYGLVDIARMALNRNQDLQAEEFGLQAGLQAISGARANLLPQIGASAAYTLRKDSLAVTSGFFAERSSDLVIGVDQLLYSDAASANLQIQKELQTSRVASFQEFKLDVVHFATTSYYSVLNARSQLAVQENNLRITRANLELAEDRVRLGTSTVADVYRWQAELARAQILVVNVRATLNQSWDALSRVLHKPQGVRFALTEASFEEPFVMRHEEFDQLVRSPADYALFSRFYIDRALRQAPELAQLDAQITAKQRELVSQRRAYWLPDFAVAGRFTSNLNQSGLGAGLQAGQDLNDWSVGVQATLPLFSGGLKRSNLFRATHELRQLRSLRAATEERVEEQVRRRLHVAQAAYAQIDLSAIAAEASRKNFTLVSDAYARGTVTIIELLDAQDTSLAASAAAAESLYNFLTTIMSVQRAVGGYDFLLSADDRAALAIEYHMTLGRSQ